MNDRKKKLSKVLTIMASNVAPIATGMCRAIFLKRRYQMGLQVLLS